MKHLNQFEEFSVKELSFEEMKRINGGEASPATKAVFEFCGFVAAKIDSFITYCGQTIAQGQGGWLTVHH
ncbi:MAG: hypothetical protein EAZ08_01470 [Cytophagales bacterium]|nr:MAG: hypothetical protein EAZ08_01470 [Cytophagales bacterium]